MSAPTRRKEDFNWRLPSDEELKIASLPQVRTNGDRYAVVRTRGRSGCDCPVCRPQPSIVKPLILGVVILLVAMVIGWIFKE